MKSLGLLKFWELETVGPGAVVVVSLELIIVELITLELVIVELVVDLVDKVIVLIVLLLRHEVVDGRAVVMPGAFGPLPHFSHSTSKKTATSSVGSPFSPLSPFLFAAGRISIIAAPYTRHWYCPLRDGCLCTLKARPERAVHWWWHFSIPKTSVSRRCALRTEMNSASKAQTSDEQLLAVEGASGVVMTCRGVGRCASACRAVSGGTGRAGLLAVIPLSCT